MVKVAILGPVPSDKVFGGVAVFTNSLYTAFKKNGDEVMIFTNYKENNNYSTETYAASKRYKKFSFINIYKIRRKVKEYNPDIIISSLDYSISVLGEKKITKIHYLHGFTSIAYYPFMKYLVMAFLDRVISKKFNYIVANSNFTRMINEDIYNNKVDAVIPIGLSYEFLENDTKEEIEVEKDIDILFVGRLVSAKHVDKLLHSIALINSDKELKIVVVGEGKERKNLEIISHENNISVNFVGKVDLEQVKTYYKRSKVFASLNDHEPFGMVFAEALYFNCNIVCPSLGGQIDLANQYPESFFVANTSSQASITIALESALTTKRADIDKEIFLENFSYDKIPRKIKRMIYK